MNYQFTSHGFQRYMERLADFPLSEFFDYVDNKSVITKVEKNHVIERLMFLPNYREFYVVMIGRNEIITVMPLIYSSRDRVISDESKDEARCLAGEEPIFKKKNKETIKIENKKKNKYGLLCSVRKDAPEKIRSINALVLKTFSEVTSENIYENRDFEILLNKHFPDTALSYLERINFNGLGLDMDRVIVQLSSNATSVNIPTS